MTANLTSSNILKLINKMSLIMKHTGTVAGEGTRHSTKTGGQMEFYDRIHYSQGEDTKYLDWHVLARHDELFIKKFTTDEKTSLHLVIDNSSSMSIGSPSKIDQARLIAALFSYMILCQGDYLTLYTLNDRLRKVSARIGGSRAIHGLIARLDSITCGGGTSYSELKTIRAMGARKREILIFISDLFGYKDITSTLMKVRSNGLLIYMVHLLSNDDIKPPLSGPSTLRDVETGRSMDVNVSESVSNAYRARILKRLDIIRHELTSHQTKYALIKSSDDAVQILRTLMSGGLLNWVKK